jgi:hypothetical protein
VGTYVFNKGTIATKKLMMEISSALPSISVKYITKKDPATVQIETVHDLTAPVQAQLQSVIDAHVYTTLRKVKDGKYFVIEKESSKILSKKKYIGRSGNVFSDIVYAEEYIYNGENLEQIKKYHFFGDDTPLIIETINKSSFEANGKTFEVEEIE